MISRDISPQLPVRDLSDSDFNATWGVISSSSKYPLSILRTSISWIRQCSYLTREQLSQLDFISDTLKEVGRGFNKYMLLPDAFDLAVGISEIPENICKAFKHLEDESHYLIVRVGLVAKDILLNTLGPLFRDAGFFLDSLANVKILDISILSPFLDVAMSVVLTTLYTNELCIAIYKYSIATDPLAARKEMLKIIQHTVDIVLCAISLAALTATPSLPVAILILTTVKTATKIGGAYIKNLNKEIELPLKKFAMSPIKPQHIVA